MTRWRILGAALIVTLLVAASPAKDIARAQKLVEEELRYAAAIDLLRDVLRAPDLEKEDRIEAYRLLGIAYAATGSEETAEATFAELLRLAPDMELDPLLSPKIRSVFERAKEQTWRPVKLQNVTAIPESRRVVVTANVVDPDARVDRVLLYSRFGDREYTPSVMDPADGRVEAVLMLPALERLRVAYYLEAVDRTGLTIARAGTADSPSSVVVERTTEIAPPPPPPPEEDPWYARWWVWAIVGGVVVAGASVAVVVTQDGGTKTPNGTLDPIQLE